MLNQLYPIQYTLVVDSKVYGYYLEDQSTSALVHQITPTGNAPLGHCNVSFPHKNSVRNYVSELTESVR